jgi:hypothetical protein
MRIMWSEGKPVSEIARRFGINKEYLRQVLHGESRPSADSHERHRAPIVSPQRYPEEYLQSPDGQLWKRPRRGPSRFKPVIPFVDIVRVRLERQERRTPIRVLAVKYGMSPSYLKEVLAGRKRVKA